MTLSIMAEHVYDECHVCCVSHMIPLCFSVFMLYIVMLHVIMLSVVMLNIVMLSVVMLNIVMLSVTATYSEH
jgi:hypothetical protein